MSVLIHYINQQGELRMTKVERVLSPIRGTPRWRCGAVRIKTLTRLARALVYLFGTFLFFRSYQYRAALFSKYQPTLFKDAPAVSTLAVTDGSSTPLRRELLENRQAWKKLGEGYEGEAYIYGNTWVIKRFAASSRIARNCLPNSRGWMRWPVEILASQILGSRSQSEDLLSPGIQGETLFVPLADYFLYQDTPGLPSRWYTVAPFMRSGDLLKLAKDIRKLNRTMHTSHQELDRHFRPSFNTLIRGLETIHAKHELCHDDIKPGNILTTPQSTAMSSLSGPLSTTHWLLGDLNNVRHLNHSYHKSNLWTDASQHPDCRVTDAIRLVKSYMVFVQSCLTGDRLVAFEEALLSGRGRLSALYWTAMSSLPRVSTVPFTRTAAEELRDLSELFAPDTGMEGNVESV